MAAYYADSTILAHTTSLQPYGRFSDPNDPDQSSSVYNLPTDTEGDAEVDELESDTDDDQVASASTAGQKKGGRKLGERVPGTTLLPASRIESMIHADGITGTLSMSKEAVFMVSIATEEFLKRIVQAGHRRASVTRRNIINYSDMALSTQQYQEFMFLRDTVPEPLSLSEALERREARLKEGLAANPAISSTNQGLSTLSAPMSSGHHTNGKLKGKHRIFSEKDRPGAHSSSVPRPGGDDKRESEMEVDEHENDHLPRPPSRSSSGRVIKASRAVREGIQDNISVNPTVVNGSANSHHQEESWSASAPPSRNASPQRPPYEFASFPSPWPGQYTGPASGYLQDPSHAWTCVKQNPGRTIYSQQSRPENTTYR